MGGRRGTGGQAGDGGGRAALQTFSIKVDLGLCTQVVSAPTTQLCR